MSDNKKKFDAAAFVTNCKNAFDSTSKACKACLVEHDACFDICSQSNHRARSDSSKVKATFETLLKKKQYTRAQIMQRLIALHSDTLSMNTIKTLVYDSTSAKYSQLRDSKRQRVLAKFVKDDKKNVMYI